MLLLYKMDDHPLLGAVRMLSAMYGHPIRMVQADEARKPLKELVSDEGTVNAVSAPVAGPVFGAVSEDPLILFAEMEQETVSSFVDQLKVLSGGTSSKVLKAMLTPTNADWNIAYLLEHLKEERAYYEKRRSDR